MVLLPYIMVIKSNKAFSKSEMNKAQVKMIVSATVTDAILI